MILCHGSKFSLKMEFLMSNGSDKLLISEVTKEELQKVSKMSSIVFNDDDLNTLQSLLNGIIDKISQFNDIDTTDVPPFFFEEQLGHGVENLRSDKIVPTMGADVITKNGPSVKGNAYVVPPVIDS